MRSQRFYILHLIARRIEPVLLRNISKGLTVDVMRVPSLPLEATFGLAHCALLRNRTLQSIDTTGTRCGNKLRIEKPAERAKQSREKKKLSTKDHTRSFVLGNKKPMKRKWFSNPNCPVTKYLESADHSALLCSAIQKPYFLFTRNKQSTIRLTQHDNETRLHQRSHSCSNKLLIKKDSRLITVISA